MKTRFAARWFVVVGGLPLIAGCVVYEQPRPRVVAPPPPTVVVAEPAPPPSGRVEVIPPRPNMGFVWVPGGWEWEGRWVWHDGRWMPPGHRGAVWVPGHWERHGHDRVWTRGHWD